MFGGSNRGGSGGGFGGGFGGGYGAPPPPPMGPGFGGRWRRRWGWNRGCFPGGCGCLPVFIFLILLLGLFVTGVL